MLTVITSSTEEHEPDLDFPHRDLHVLYASGKDLDLLMVDALEDMVRNGTETWEFHASMLTVL